MPGVLTHLIVAFVGFCIIYLIFFKSKYKILYGLVFFIGHLAPDILDFGIAGIKQWSLDPEVIMTNPWFRPLAILGHTFTNWVVLVFVIFFVVFLLFKFKKISKEKFIVIFISLMCFLSAVFIHLRLDLLIIETSYWI